MLIVKIVITIYNYLEPTLLVMPDNNLLLLCLWEVIYKISDKLNLNFHSKMKWENDLKEKSFGWLQSLSHTLGNWYF